MKIIEKTLKWASALNLTNKPKSLVLHHAEWSVCTLEDIHRVHLNNGWSGIDDMSTSRYCASCGGDWWREAGLTWAPDWSNNKGIAQPKIMEVTNDWNRFSMTTVPQNWANGFPE